MAFFSGVQEEFKTMSWPSRAGVQEACTLPGLALTQTMPRPFAAPILSLQSGSKSIVFSEIILHSMITPHGLTSTPIPILFVPSDYISFHHSLQNHFPGTTMRSSHRPTDPHDPMEKHKASKKTHLSRSQREEKSGQECESVTLAI